MHLKCHRLLLCLCVFAFLPGCNEEERRPQAASESKAPQSLQEMRKGFHTQILEHLTSNDRPDQPPPGVFDLIQYRSRSNKLAAYVTPDPKDGKKHAAILWAHGGFDGIGSYLWEEGPADNDQSTTAYREAGLIVMCPSWRGESGNLGRQELFYGEVDDFLAALDYLRGLPYVDPERVYIGGHSTGGTMVLLGAVSTDKFRAAFSFGGSPDVEEVALPWSFEGNVPFNPRSKEECRMRSPIHVVGAIKRPTFYFEDAGSPYCEDARKMEMRADGLGVPFKTFLVPRADHFDLLHPVNRLIAEKILKDTGPSCNITITMEEVTRAHTGR